MRKTNKNKRNATLKIFIVFAAILIGVSIGVICGKVSGEKAKYKQDFSFTKMLNFKDSPYLTGNGIDRIEDEDLELLLEKAKKKILACKELLDNKVETLHWEILDDIEIYYSTKFIDELGDETNPKAHYNSANNSVEVNFLAKGMSDLEGTIIHEILHGLVKNVSINTYAGSSIIEALVENLTKVVVGDSYEMYYYEEYHILAMMYNIWGEKETIGYILNGEEIFEKIDELTKKGYGKKAMQALDCFTSYKTTDIETAACAFAISQEIIVNATAKRAAELNSEEMVKRCSELLIKIEEEHFLKILGLLS